MAGVNGTAEAPDHGAAQATSGGPGLAPLRVRGLVVSKEDLVEFLRPFVPALADVQAAEDGRHFWLLLEEADEAGVRGDTSAHGARRE